MAICGLKRAVIPLAKQWKSITWLHVNGSGECWTFQIVSWITYLVYYLSSWTSDIRHIWVSLVSYKQRHSITWMIYHPSSIWTLNDYTWVNYRYVLKIKRWKANLLNAECLGLALLTNRMETWTTQGGYVMVHTCTVWVVDSFQNCSLMMGMVLCNHHSIEKCNFKQLRRNIHRAGICPLRCSELTYLYI